MSKAAEFGAVAEHATGTLMNPHYGLVIYPYACGQFRLQLTDMRKPDHCIDGHGSVVREMCTYSRARADEVAKDILYHADPEAYCESLANERNCEFPRGRIRLDNA